MAILLQGGSKCNGKAHHLMNVLCSASLKQSVCFEDTMYLLLHMQVVHDCVWMCGSLMFTHCIELQTKTLTCLPIFLLLRLFPPISTARDNMFQFLNRSTQHIIASLCSVITPLIDFRLQNTISQNIKSIPNSQFLSFIILTKVLPSFTQTHQSSLAHQAFKYMSGVLLQFLMSKLQSWHFHFLKLIQQMFQPEPDRTAKVLRGAPEIQSRSLICIARTCPEHPTVYSKCTSFSPCAYLNYIWWRHQCAHTHQQITLLFSA